MAGSCRAVKGECEKRTPTMGQSAAEQAAVDLEAGIEIFALFPTEGAVQRETYC